MRKLVFKPKILEFEFSNYNSERIVLDTTYCSMGFKGINPFNPHENPVKDTL